MEIMELFIGLVGKYNALDKMPVKVGPGCDLYHSERHMLDKVGDHPGMNVTDFARALGVTKGAVSQVVKKLERKGVVKRYRSESNSKEVFLELTELGRSVYMEHKKKNEETIRPLVHELNKYSDDKVQFLIDMFKWIEGFLDQEGKHMRYGR